LTHSLDKAQINEGKDSRLSCLPHSFSDL